MTSFQEKVTDTAEGQIIPQSGYDLHDVILENVMDNTEINSLVLIRNRQEMMADCSQSGGAG